MFRAGRPDLCGSALVSIISEVLPCGRVSPAAEHGGAHSISVSIFATTYGVWGTAGCLHQREVESDGLVHTSRQALHYVIFGDVFKKYHLSG